MKSASANWSSGTIVSTPAESYERSTQVVAWSSPPDPSAVSSADALAEHAATDTTIASRARARRMFMGGPVSGYWDLPATYRANSRRVWPSPATMRARKSGPPMADGRDRERLDEAEGGTTGQVDPPQDPRDERVQDGDPADPHEHGGDGGEAHSVALQIHDGAPPVAGDVHDRHRPDRDRPVPTLRRVCHPGEALGRPERTSHAGRPRPKDEQAIRDRQAGASASAARRASEASKDRPIGLGARTRSMNVLSNEPGSAISR